MYFAKQLRQSRFEEGIRDRRLLRGGAGFVFESAEIRLHFVSLEWVAFLQRSPNGQLRLRDQLCLFLIRQYNLDGNHVKAYPADFCGTEALRGASRELVGLVGCSQQLDCVVLAVTTCGMEKHISRVKIRPLHSHLRPMDRA